MEERRKRTRLSKEDALNLMQKFCSIQDRCQSEIRTRLIEHSVYGDDLEEIIADLISDNFINEERFAKAYVRGKFRMKKWGKLKITKELKLRRISAYSIRKGMQEIDYDAYLETLEGLLLKKVATLRISNKWEKRKKLTSYAIQKGFEYEVIKEVMSTHAELKI
ncbi:MAG: regulatory protein RecX [Saprospiraceae bacterium]|nr:regulatory protein RecX [Saprospiraceae bacterium]